MVKVFFHENENLILLNIQLIEFFLNHLISNKTIKLV